MRDLAEIKRKRALAKKVLKSARCWAPTPRSKKHRSYKKAMHKQECNWHTAYYGW